MGVIQKLIINNSNHFLFNSANEMLYKSLYISLFFVNYKIYPCYKYYVAGVILNKSGYPRLIFMNWPSSGTCKGVTLFSQPK